MAVAVAVAVVAVVVVMVVVVVVLLFCVLFFLRGLFKQRRNLIQNILVLNPHCNRIPTKKPS